MDLPIDITNITLETDRLILRAWHESDLYDLYEYAGIPGVGEMAGWKHHESIEESKRILEIFIADKNVFAVTLRETGKVIGSVGIHPSWANDEPGYQNLKLKEIGYVLSKDFWGQGLMPEAVKAVIGYCFETLGLDALTVGHFTENRQSQSVIEKCGFQLVKHSEYYAKQLDRYFDDVKYIMLREPSNDRKS